MAVDNSKDSYLQIGLFEKYEDALERIRIYELAQNELLKKNQSLTRNKIGGTKTKRFQLNHGPFMINVSMEFEFKKPE